MALSSHAGQAAQLVIAHHSKSFAWASRLLPSAAREDAVILYAWCRRADDAVDEATSPAAAAQALRQLQDELAAIYRQEPQSDLLLAAFADLLQRRNVPAVYPQELLAGMQMDSDGERYDNSAQLRLYCWRVAGVVGLMMCHVMGISQTAALRQAAQLGVAMQLTNISRDVAEDWARGRLYLPQDVLERHGLGILPSYLDRPFPPWAKPALADAVRELLDNADELYAMADQGLQALPWRCAFAIALASAVYADIGVQLRGQGCDPLPARAHTTASRKLWLTARTLGRALLNLPSRLRILLRGGSQAYRPPEATLQLAELFDAGQA